MTIEIFVSCPFIIFPAQKNGLAPYPSDREGVDPRSLGFIQIIPTGFSG
jgi:hypothetical protein